MRMTRGLKLRTTSWVLKFNRSSPKAIRDTRARAIFRYVLVTRALPNWAKKSCLASLKSFVSEDTMLSPGQHDCRGAVAGRARKNAVDDGRDLGDRAHGGKKHNEHGREVRDDLLGREVLPDVKLGARDHSREDEDVGVGNDRIETVLEQGLQPAPEYPLHLRDNEER